MEVVLGGGGGEKQLCHSSRYRRNEDGSRDNPYPETCEIRHRNHISNNIVLYNYGRGTLGCSVVAVQCSRIKFAIVVSG